jgi:plasmid stabilization system protein ParE
VVVRFRAEAANDVLSARSWYEEQRVGLGNEFAMSLEHIVDLLSAHPDAFPEIASGYRRALLPRFPYALYYRVGTHFIDVIACLHTRRSPDRWRRKR